MKQIILILAILALMLMPVPANAEYKQGDWLTVTVDNVTLSSDEVNLGEAWTNLNVYVPTINSDNVTLYISRTVGGTYSRLGLSGVTIATTTGNLYCTVTLNNLQFIKLVMVGPQTSTTRTFYVQGWRP